ncbi:MAG: hypothetical protein RLZZ244_1721 [Verrucomicrobiota bacterium]|jgi:poly(3-hydroxybutyrate) depolymerase
MHSLSSRTIAALLLLALPLAALAEPPPQTPLPGWPPAVSEQHYRSRADQTLQPTLFYRPQASTPAPLLVALHTWGGTHLQAEPAYAEWCIRKGWVLVHPHFRGPNKTPEACGSDLVVQDILSVVEWAQSQAPVDPNRIYLIGCSGGGFASMLLAGRAPHLWAGVSQWCGIFDLRDWHSERSRNPSDPYARMMEAACGGPPGSSPEVDAQYRHRSASTWFASAAGIPMDLNTGIWDGHKGSVPVSHSLKAFNTLAAPEKRIPDEDLRSMTTLAQVPEALRFDGGDPLYSKRPVLLRRISGQTRVTVFEGGHESVLGAGLAWLELQRKGQPAVWNVPAPSAAGGSSPGSLGGAAEVGR